MKSWSLRKKTKESTTIRLRPWLLEELKAIAYENKGEGYSLNGVVEEFLEMAAEGYRTEYPRTAPNPLPPDAGGDEATPPKRGGLRRAK